MPDLSDVRSTLMDVLKASTHQVESVFDTAIRRTKKRLGWFRPVHIRPYRGFGNPQELFLQGRVLERRKIGSPGSDDPWWENLLDMYRRFASAEVPFCRVRAQFQGQTVEAQTDEEGYYEFRLRLEGPLDRSRLWHEVELELVDQIVPGQGPVTAVGQVLVPPDDSAFGVISDIDDTILRSHATDLLKIARITFLNNARTRLPLPGMAEFYRALERGPTGSMQNPFFYVSSSAWNLYDLFVDFLELNDIPAGPILLRDLGFDRHKFIKTGHSHKLEKIRHILTACPETPFILVGDAGQKDPILYRQVVAEHPGRIKAVYIRRVAWRDRSDEIHALAAEVRREGVEMLLVEDSEQAARHAAEQGYISPDTLAAIREERRRDQTDPERVQA